MILIRLFALKPINGSETLSRMLSIYRLLSYKHNTVRLSSHITHSILFDAISKCVSFKLANWRYEKKSRNYGPPSLIKPEVELFYEPITNVCLTKLVVYICVTVQC